MRKAILNGILIVGISLAIHKGFSQTNNLYFNQVLLVGATTMTVPANKVWKLEGFVQNTYSIFTASTGCGSSNYFHGFYINGNLYGFPYFNNYNNTLSASHFPLWLPAGTTLRTECTNDFLSVIEFNVAP